MSYESIRLKDLCIDGKGNYGIPASAVPFCKNLYSYLRITDITDDGRINKSNLVSVDDEKAGNYLLKPNDIVFARTGGSTGRSYFYDGSDGEFVYAGFLIKFSIDASKVNPKYIKYFCQSNQYKDWVSSFNTGSTRGNINAQTFANMEIPVPSETQQNLLVSILSALDDKIELNNKINKNLEEMAQAIFKSWFVDFEPFQDGEFVDSELGMIPKGWRVGTLSEISKDIVCGKTPLTSHHEYYDGNIPFVTIPDMHGNTYVIKTERYLTNEGAASQSNKTLPADSICVSCIATAGLVALTADDCQTNQQINSIVCKEDISPYYIFLTMLGLSEHIKILGSSGSTTCNLNKGQFSKIEILIPHTAVLIDFSEKVRPIFKDIKQNQIENEKLSKLRDTLLPKLLSGEIRVPLEVE